MTQAMNRKRASLELQLLLLEAGAEIRPAIPADINTDLIFLEKYEKEFE